MTLHDPMNCSPQIPLSMELSRQEYWSGLPVPSSGNLPNPGIKPRSPALQADSLLSEPPRKPKYDPVIPLLQTDLGNRKTSIHTRLGT